MNEDLKKNQPSNDEVDLGQLFNAIGRLFERLFAFITAIFTLLFGFFIFILKSIFDNIKLIATVVSVAFVLGFAIDKIKLEVYASNMLVRPYFDSKFHLINNIHYYNSLVSNGDIKALSNIFNIGSTEAAELKGFDINLGPENDNDRTLAYYEFLKSIDSLSAETYRYTDFIKNRDIYSGKLFEITVKSTKSDIFKSLESGLNNALWNPHSERLKQKKDTMFAIQTSNIKSSLATVDSLKQVFISVLQQESDKGTTTISLGKDFALEAENSSKSRELELLNREIELRNKLAELEELKIEEDTLFDVVSSFQNVGSKSSELLDKFAYLLPLTALFILIIVFIINRTVSFVRSYEG